MKQPKQTPTLFVSVSGENEIWRVVLKNSDTKTAKDKARELYNLCKNPVKVHIQDENTKTILYKKF